MRAQRLQRGVSLRELAKRIGVSAGTVSAIENGKTGISVERLQRIAAALDVPVATLFGSASPAPATSRSPQPPPTTASEVPESHWRSFAPLPIDSVLAAAIRAFVATGYHGASMRSIAQLADRSVPGVYHHYASKQDLLVKILDMTMADLIWRLEQARAEATDPTERLALFVEALALFHARRNDLAFIGASEMRSLEPDGYRRIAELRRHVQGLLDQEIASAVRHAGLTVPHAADAGKAIATMCTALAQWFHPDGRTTPEQIAREYAAFALRLLGLGPAGACSG